ncbi:unnamed protein product [Calicophoron daubneyi]|uniref:RRM domain-containing protein n=1 Tax=Calicophoron daubneyi TaxID=300641 RepID=A0AAV2TDB1_CALDB
MDLSNRISEQKSDLNVWYPQIRSYGFYDPVMAGSIDGTDKVPHDRAILRVLNASYKPVCSSYIGFTPKATVFVGRLPYTVDEPTLFEALRKLLLSSKSRSSRHWRSRSPQPRSRHADEDDKTSKDRRARRQRSRSPFASPESVSTKWPKIRIVRNVVTGYPCGYAFACFESADDAARVLSSWQHQCNRFCPQGKAKPQGLDIPNGEKVILEPALGETLPGWRPRRLGGGLGGRKEAGQLRFGGVARPFRRPFTFSHT